MRTSPLSSRIGVLLLLLLAGCHTSRELHVWEYGQVQQQFFNEVISFEEEAGLIFFEVMIEGKKRKFLFDTGAPNVLSRSLMLELNLVPITYRQVKDSNGRSRELAVVELDELRIGGLLFTDTRAIVAGLENVDLFNCLGIDGVIGANLMKLAKWQIDFSTQKITISDQIERLDTGRGSSVPFTVNPQGTPCIQLTIDNSPVKVELDFGSTGGFSLNRKLLADLPHGDIVNRSFGLSSIGLYGPMEDVVTHYRYEQVRLDNLLFRDQVVKFESNGSSSVGTEVLRHFIVTIDWSSRLLYFHPLRPPHTSPSSYHDFGLIIIPQAGRMTVARVFENSPASRAGLRKGDTVHKLNGRPDFYWLQNGGCELYQFFLDIPPGPDTLQVEFSRGGQRRTGSLPKADLYSYGR